MYNIRIFIYDFFIIYTNTVPHNYINKLALLFWQSQTSYIFEDQICK